MDPNGARHRRRLAADQAGTTGTHFVVTATAPPLERDWSELPVDALSSVFAKLAAVEILMGAGLVCRSWLQAAGLPELWRSVDMAGHRLVEAMDSDDALRAMAIMAVDRSGGQLEVFVRKRFVNDEFLKYMGDRASSLKRLHLISCNGVSNAGLAEAVTKFRLLEELVISLFSNVNERFVFETVGKSCPKLTHFRLNKNSIHRYGCSTSYKDKEAMGIATMTELSSLRLFGCSLTNAGLTAILDSCPLLEALDIRYSFNIKEDDTLREKCAGLKALRLPEDSIDDYEFQDQLPIWGNLPFYVIDLISDDDDDFGI